MTAVDRVRKLIADHLNVALDRVTDGASFIDDLNADSLDHVEIVIALEEEFGIEIADQDAEDVRSVGDAVKLVARHAKAAP